MSFPEYIESRSDIIVELTIEHAQVVALSMGIAALIGIGLGIAVYRRERSSIVALAVVGVFLTIPSFALFGLLVAPLGLGYQPTVLALVMYALLPITRNTVTGLRGVDPAVIESARGMGMGYTQRLIRVELPLAWPVILTGLRVSTLIILGIAAIAAAINGPGLGELIFGGLTSIGAVNSVNQTVAGMLGVMVLAVLADLLFLLLRTLTTSPGVRG